MDRDVDRIRTILGGTPLSAENIRLSEEALGTQWHGTSWFFLMHLIAKTFTKEPEMKFSAIKTVINNYGIQNWTDEYNLRKQLNKFVEVFERRGLGNVHFDKDTLKIDGIISRDELNVYAEKQYEYAMGEGLVRYSTVADDWVERKMSNFGERFWWHYMMQIFDAPKVYSSITGESALKALFTDMQEKMSSRHLTFHGVEIWKKSQLEHTLALLEGWERGLISRRILSTFKFGDVEFVAPRFFAKPDSKPLGATIFSDANVEKMLKLIEKLRRFPGYPVYKGNTEEYALSASLERAGAVTRIPETKTTYNTPQLVYLVSKDFCDEINKRINFKYSENPRTEFGDNSLTDELFRTLGRARALTQKVLPEARIDTADHAPEIHKIFTLLETRKRADLGDFSSVFEPLSGLFGAIEIDNKGIAHVKGDYDFIIKILCDCWDELMNDRTVADVLYPATEEIQKSEKSQVEAQVKNSLKAYFKK